MHSYCTVSTAAYVLILYHLRILIIVVGLCFELLFQIKIFKLKGLYYV